MDRQSAVNSEDIENVNFIFPCTDFLKYLDKGKDEELFSRQAIMKDAWKNWKSLQVVLIGHLLHRS